MKDRLETLLTTINGVTVTASTQAPHCGVCYFNFKASEEGIKEVCKLAAQHNIFIRVYLDDLNEIAYSIGIAPFEANRILCEMY